ncbi:MAG: TOTE conflict system archaeo-eukaryotic primase domain-containing protein, partial [Terriglobia bacterium]
MEQRLTAKPEVVKDYFRLFVNRRAYTMQSMRPNTETGKHCYFRPTGKGGAPPSLTQETIRRHLEGEITIALYAINPGTQRCRWVAIDADYKHAMEDLVKLEYYLKQDQVEPALEMSKRGGHLWVFLDTPLLARDCRVYIYNLALRLGVPVKGAGLAEGIEIFPKHDQLGPREFGNAIRGPMGIHRGANRRYWFYGAEYSLEDQMAYLKRLRKVTEQEMQ